MRGKEGIRGREGNKGEGGSTFRGPSLACLVKVQF